MPSWRNAYATDSKPVTCKGVKVQILSVAPTYRGDTPIMHIYKITNLIDGKMYVGKEVNPEQGYYGSGLCIKRAISKYGKENFKKDTIETCVSENELNNKEIHWIKTLNTTIPNGYNIAIGGGGGPHFRGHKHSDKTREKMRLFRLGTHLTQKTREKMSESKAGQLGHKHTKEYKIMMSGKKKLWWKNKKDCGETEEQSKIKYNNIDLLEEMVKSGFVHKRCHPNGRFFIYNYTDKCTYGKNWNAATLQARGLILDSDGYIIARPFNKFFCMGEREETMFKNLPQEEFEATEKMDGSLAILFRGDCDFCIATRGSFVSDQAQWANKYLKNVWGSKVFNLEYTYLFEAIYPENKIIVNYKGFSGLVLLSCIRIKDGQEMSYNDVRAEAERLDVPLVKRYQFKTMDELVLAVKKIKGTEQEGFVVRFKNGLRVKVKSEDYLRLFKIIKCFTPLAVYETMVEGAVPREYLAQIPEELRGTADEYRDKLQKAYADKKNEIMGVYDSLAGKGLDNQKDFALYVMQNHKAISGALFALKRGFSVDSFIMREIKPIGNVIHGEEDI